MHWWPDLGLTCVEYLKPSSVALALKRNTMHTFSDQKVSNKLSNSKKEKKIVSLCLKRRLKAKCIPATGKCEQYLELPRTIATSDGMSQKGDKANARSYLDKRYRIQLEDNSWTPDTVIRWNVFKLHKSYPKHQNGELRPPNCKIIHSVHYLHQARKD